MSTTGFVSDTPHDRPRRPPLPPGPWLVVGLARSGRAALEVLRARGEQARGVDRRQGDDTPGALEHVHAVVKSPGVPAQAEVIAAARERGLPVLGEVELAWRLIPNEFVAVTGTNGKTTTTELIGHIHREAGRPVAVAGNVGTALSSLVGHIPEAATVVCEVSSFQLEDAVEFAPEGAVLLNIAPDHLDRHGTLAAYIEAKLRVFAHQGNDDVAVAPLGLGVEDLGGCARRVCFGDGPQAELSDRAGHLWWAEEPLIAVDEVASARAAQSPQRDGRGGDLPGAWHRRRRRARRAAHLRRRRAPSRGCGHDRAACSTSTTRRPPTSPRRWWRSRASTRPST